ncbi:MAG TPA: Asp-tRNA(Asn)/Glu-tRNA(Gln) amidotransferase subunit GatB, partial [Actinobacteria bacterium]|nr:Asp-tRNA(Asn)/Glu-tRNA(Gln) amidotransferase subunit GatB [Actinomycetota bacterium]
YFYADLPKNYQISQFDLPVCEDGYLEIEGDAGGRVGIERVHQEEDTGKSNHMGGDGRITSAEYSLLDFNRSGVPLVEIVTKPEIRSAAQARAYGLELRAVIVSLGVSDAKLEEGSIRFDANISVRPSGTTALGTKVEIKNMNSYRSMERAIAHEVIRQAQVLDGGGRIVQETRHWDEDAGVTRSGRVKEGFSDYRFFSEPDMVPMVIDQDWQDRIAGELPELPVDRRKRYRGLGLDKYQAALVAGSEPDLVQMFEGAVAAGGTPPSIANWLTGEVVAALRRNDQSLSDSALSTSHLVELVGLVEASTISTSAAKAVLAGVLDGEGSPGEVAEDRDLLQVSDSGTLQAAVEQAISDNADEFARLTSGEQKLIGFFVGQVMKLTGGKADPKIVTSLLQTRLSD